MAAEGMIQGGIFEDLQKKIDEDTRIKDVRGLRQISSHAKFDQHQRQALRDIVQTLEKQGMPRQTLEDFFKI